MGQTHFSFSPQNPQPGDLITISYEPSVAITGTPAPFKAIVYTLGSKGETANDLELKKSGNGYSGTVTTDTSDNLVFFGFSADKNFDNNSGNGYWIQLYSGDQVKKGSDLSLSQFYQYYGQSGGIDPDNEKALHYMEADFAADPGSEKKNLISFVQLYAQLHRDEAPVFIEKQIESLIKSGLEEEQDYSNLQRLYALAKLPQQAKMVEGVKKEKFPDGQWKINATAEDYLKENDLARKESMLDDMSARVKKDADWKFLDPSLSYFQSALVSAYQQKEDWAGMDRVIAKYHITGMDLAGIYNNAAWEIQKTDSNLDVAARMAAAAVSTAKEEWKNPTGPKPAYRTRSQWEVSRKTSYAMYADTYAMINYKLGNYKKGFPFAEDAALKIGEGKSADENNTYALLAEKSLSPKKYVRQLEQFVKDGKATSAIKDILRRAYAKNHGSENGYDAYMAALEKDSYLEMIAELKKGILNDAAPSFSLVDLKGNKVNIGDLKNKIVVVDFWATWCGPCKASFPGMQKMITQYKDDPGVQFVFVDTWETTDQKEKNAADFIAAHKYDFHVLMDNDSKVVEQFKVSGIPTKFIIDKNGVIRFKAIGFDGSDDKLVKELTAMIDMAKTL
jgi:peroxiredoxin